MKQKPGIKLCKISEFQFKKNASYMSIIGDLVPNTHNKSISISEDLLEFLKKITINVANLESPVTENNGSINKIGPILKSSSNDAVILNQLNIKAVTLANNHINDLGMQGILDTVKYLQEKRIDYTGIGRNLKEAKKIYTQQMNNTKIGILNICEHEFSVATDNDFGANPIDLFTIYQQVQSLKENSDIAIVIIHGGKEGYPYPNPFIYNLFHLLADLRVDLVIGHHTHIISGFEIADSIPLIYSLGNFYFFDPDEVGIDWYTGLIAVVELVNYSITNVFLIPVFMDMENKILRFTNDYEFEHISKNISKLNRVIDNRKLLFKEWDVYSSRMENQYIKRMLGINKLKRVLLKLPLFNYKLLKRRQRLTIEHYLHCETHLDLLKSFLRKPDRR